MPPENQTPVTQTLAERLQAARQGIGTQEKVAELLGVNRAAVSQWETGDTKPSVEMAIKLSLLTGASLDWLLMGLHPDVVTVHKNAGVVTSATRAPWERAVPAKTEPMPPEQTLGDRIQLLRKARLPEYAALLSVPVESVSNWERGICLPCIPVAIRIAALHEVSLDWLLTGKGEGPKTAASLYPPVFCPGVFAGELKALEAKAFLDAPEVLAAALATTVELWKSGYSFAAAAKEVRNAIEVLSPTASGL